jgi:hypothetical protein
MKKFSQLTIRRKLIKLGFFVFISVFGFVLLRQSDRTELLSSPHKVSGQPAPCKSLQPESGAYKEAVIEKSGNYCVTTNFWQRKLYDFAGHSGPNSYRHLITVTASNVIIDLSNHILHTDGHSGAIDISLDYRNIRSPDQETIQHLSMANNVTVKNGVLDLRGLGIALENTDKWRMRTIDEKIPKGFRNYEKTNITIENVLIKTDNIGIILEGEGNIIKNCIIESGGTTAITMAGPNGAIINNRIILTNPFIPGNMRGTSFQQTEDFSELFESRREHKAAIALHQATGTVISGNVIEVKGKSETRHNIYLTDSSKNVRIEGNKFLGEDDPIRLVNGSTAAMKNNVFEFKKPWWKF